MRNDPFRHNCKFASTFSDFLLSPTRHASPSPSPISTTSPSPQHETIHSFPPDSRLIALPFTCTYLLSHLKLVNIAPAHPQCSPSPPPASRQCQHHPLAFLFHCSLVFTFVTTYFTMDFSRHSDVFKAHLLLSRSASIIVRVLRPKFYLLFTLLIAPRDSPSVTARPSLAFPRRFRHPTWPCAAERSSTPSLGLSELPPTFVIVPPCSHALTHTLNSYSRQPIETTAYVPILHSQGFFFHVDKDACGARWLWRRVHDRM